MTKKREVITAKSAGFCFGVEKAVNTVYEEVNKGNKVFTLGPIIHNEEVVKDLESKGVTTLKNIDDIDKVNKGTLIIRSHGVGKYVYDICNEKNINIVDATCPYVKKIHKLVQKYSLNKDTVVIIGNPDHPEVIGIKGWGNEDTYAVNDFEEFLELNLDKEKNIVVVGQTTYNYIKFQKIVEKMVDMGYHVSCYNTICNATQDRQSEAAKVASEVSAMIVIGDKSSSNTAKLVEICKKECEKTIFIQTFKDLDKSSLESIESVGITAGASTPKHIIEEVQNNVRS